METFKNNIGVIEKGVASKSFRIAGINSKNGYRLIKILPEHQLIPDWVQKNFPEAILATNIEELMQDSSIDLVMVSANDENHKDIVANFLQKGKHVRVV